jgi:hypothetical protein
MFLRRKETSLTIDKATTRASTAPKAKVKPAS